MTQEAELKIHWIGLLLLLCSFQALPAAGRQSLSLDGEWKMLPRLSDVGEGGRHAFEAPGTNRAAWRSIQVPSCWERQFEDLKYFEGLAWYFRTFNFEGDPAAVHAELVFEGVNYLSRIYLNGKTLADHEGGYTEFRVPLDGSLVKGENSVAVRVDNRRHLLRVPANVGWANYGGIYRPVRLEITPKVHLAQNYVRTLSLGPQGASLEASAVVEGLGRDGTAQAVFSLELLDREGRTAGTLRQNVSLAGEGSTLRGTFTVKPKDTHPWSPDNPYLYKAVASLSVQGGPEDRVETTAGIRTYSVRGRDFLLNGQPFKVRGICYHVDFPKTGRTLDPGMFATDLANFRELGVNAVRCHYPLEARMLSALDSLGVLVWMEDAVYWVHDYDLSRQDLACNLIREIALAHRNHPAVMVWSLGNECGFDEREEVLFFGALHQELRRWVPDGLTSYAHNGNSSNPTNWEEIYSTNLYPGWYTFLGRRPVQWSTDSTELATVMAEQGRELERRVREFPVMPFWVSEIGGGGAVDFPRGDWELFSENYQATLLGSQLNMIAAVPEFSGIFPWVYSDFYDPSRAEVPGQNGKNVKGVVTIDRKHKKSFGVLKDFYSRWGR